jgi:hypothetical protein
MPKVPETKVERAFGETGVPTVFGRSTEFMRAAGMRVDNNGMFSGPRPTYGRYQVDENATDAIVRGNRINQ